MIEEPIRQMLRERLGALEAPAGTGKTEQISLIARDMPGRWLILTHTVAGVEAIRRRLSRYEVGAEKAQVETLSAWSHRWAHAFPIGSSLPVGWSARGGDWDAIISAAALLVESGAVASVLRASYQGVLVDEYQDCTTHHHRLVVALAAVIPCYVFGDPLQAIFGFRPDMLIDWNERTLVDFPLAGRLEIPHRWINKQNTEFGNWLIAQRENFFHGRFDFRGAPACVSWKPRATRQGANSLRADCNKWPGEGETFAILHSGVSEIQR